MWVVVGVDCIGGAIDCPAGGGMLGPKSSSLSLLLPLPLSFAELSSACGGSVGPRTLLLGDGAVFSSSWGTLRFSSIVNFNLNCE